MTLDPVRFTRELVAKVKAALQPLEDRLTLLEQQEPIPGPKGEAGIDGKDGRDGIDGKDGSVGPVGTQGENGKDGTAGRDGLDGKDGADGRHGRDGKDGRDGIDGKDGTAGRGIKAAHINADGRLVLTLSDGDTIDLGLVKGESGRDGQPGVPGWRGEKGGDGKDGIDGLGFDDIEQDYDGERRVTFTFARGDRKKRLATIVLPIQIYRGVYEDGKAYERGDTVTWGGSQWHAKEDTSAKPGGSDAASRAWVLCVKKGADGKAGPAGPKADIKQIAADIKQMSGPQGTPKW